jgi:hypothetical protein
MPGMSSKSMPGKLMVLVFLMGIGVLVNLLTGALFSAAIGVALVVGVLVGNDGVRKFLIGLSALQIVWAVIVLIGASALGSGALAIAGIFAIGIPALYIWVLVQEDVRDWMFRKNFHVQDDVNLPPSA